MLSAVLIAVSLAAPSPSSPEIVLQVPELELAGRNLLPDPGAEIGDAAPLKHWSRFVKGYELGAGRTGRSIKASSLDPRDETGASATLVLNQSAPEALLVAGWSAAEAVSGEPSSGYSLYVDCVYADGTPLWGVHGTFRTGTHGWERAWFVVVPEKPIRTLTLYCLFRGHTGTALFDDLVVAPLPAGTARFDGVPVAPRAALAEGFLLRDLGERDRSFVSIAPGGEALGVRLDADEQLQGGARTFRARLTTTSSGPRLLTLYWVAPFDAVGGAFFRDALRSEEIAPASAVAETVPVSAGATGTMARYPLIAVAPRSGDSIEALAVPLDQPVVTRLAYHAPWKLLTVAFDVALDRRVLAHPGTVELRWVRYGLRTTWGFRAAFKRYTELFPASFVKRVPVEGIWMPFYDIAKVKGAEDFHFGFKEGNDNVAYDDAHGVLTFRYVEPMSHWLSMPKEIPRTPDDVLRVLGTRIAEGDRQALATLSSGIWDEAGTYRFSIHDTPWCDGAVFALNPDPGLEAAASKARLNYDPAKAEREYAAGLDGEYLDSLEGWNDLLNFRPDHIRESSVPPSFDRLSKKPCLLNAFSVYAYTAHVAENVHRRGRLLMANSTPYRFGLFCHFVDVAGTETNWKPRGVFRFDPPELMAYRRTLMGTKPYLFLQNTPWEGWTKEDSERFMRCCLAWGMYPGFFSPDASTRHYFSKPELYDRDRDLFKRYVPLVKLVSKAGWQPVTLASGAPGICVERWGDIAEGACYLTVFNPNEEPRDVEIRLEAPLTETRAASELVAGRAIDLRRDGVALRLPGQDVALVRLRREP